MPRGTATGRRCFRRCADWRRSRESWSAPAQTGEAPEDDLARASAARPDADRLSTERMEEITRGAPESDRPPRELAHAPESISPKPRIDLKAAVSQIAMRRQELNARAGRSAPEPMRPTSGTVAVEANGGGAAAPAETKQKHGEADAIARAESRPFRRGLGRRRSALRTPASRPHPRNCCATTFEPSSASSTTCGASGPMSGPARSTSAGCAPRSRP